MVVVCHHHESCVLCSAAHVAGRQLRCSRAEWQIRVLHLREGIGSRQYEDAKESRRHSPSR